MTLQPDGTPDPASAYDVPADAPRHACPTCGAPFPEARGCLLHQAQVHGAEDQVDELGASDGTTLVAARSSEERALRRFRLKALGAVVLLYFVLVMIYALV